ncbi:MAG: DUF563 domain-containing protein [Promethearchaeota archaeon]
MPFSNTRILLKGAYISNIKQYFSNNLEEINYLAITPKFFIKFSKEEMNFLGSANQDSIRNFTEIQSIILKKYINPEISIKFNFQREVFLCMFKNIKFYGDTGFLVLNKKVLIESAYNPFRYCMPRMDFQGFHIKRKIKGVHTSIMYWDYDNYYHFFIDNLPRLYAILKIKEPKINLIVPKDYRKFYLEIIKIFLDKRFKIVYINPNEVWEIERFYFPSFCSNVNIYCRHYIPKLYLDFMKEKIFKKLEIKKRSQNNRIYISRKKARNRRLLNEDELLGILKKYNFKKIHCEDLSFKKQVELFNSAEIIIAPHGAGLTNIIFSMNLKVIELFSPKYIAHNYFMLCKTLKFHYRYIIGYETNYNFDFRVDLKKVEKILNELIEI